MKRKINILAVGGGKGGRNGAIPVGGRGVDGGSSLLGSRKNDWGGTELREGEAVFTCPGKGDHRFLLRVSVYTKGTG